MHVHVFVFRCIALMVCLCLSWPVASWGQNTNDGFDPNANGAVRAFALQADGKILVGGDFTTLAGGATARNRIARLNPDGSVDSSFNPNANNSVFALAVQADGKILVGGVFTTLDGGATGRKHIARLNTDGSVDSAFNADTNGDVYALAVLADGKILVGGYFTTLAGTTHHCIARLNADGSVDGSFDLDANSGVRALALQADGKILVGGTFASLDGGATMTNRIARLNADGSVDSSFTPNANLDVYALALQADGKVVAGGKFTTLAGGATVRNRIARINADGSVDSSFNPDANGDVHALAVQADGKILAGGLFTTLAGGATMLKYIARFNAAGSVDTSFNPNANGAVHALALQADGKILIGGDFTTLAGTTRNRIARLNVDGSVDSSFNPNANNAVVALALQADGKILVGGYFTTLDGGVTTRNRIARLNADGSVGISLNANANNAVYALAVQADGKILAGGLFTTLAGGTTVRNHIARFKADGSIDSTFNPNANDDVYALAPQADGKILLGGTFTALAGGATTRNFIARLNADGSVDSSFNPNANNPVFALAVQADGKILVGGVFTTLANGATVRNHIARLNADGSVDSSFDPNANGTVNALALQADGKILIGGKFTTLDGGVTTRNRIARLNADGSVDGSFDPNANNSVIALALQADGKILLGGDFTTLAGTTRNRIARLNADGSVDSSFGPNANNSVLALALQADGKVVVGGQFTTLDGATQSNNIARLSTPQAALQSVTLTGGTVTWLRSGAGPELAQPPTLEFSLDGVAYTPMGSLSRIAGGWQRGGLTQPVNQTFYLRLLGPVSSGQYGGSQGLIETVRQFYGNDRIFADGFE